MREGLAQAVVVGGAVLPLISIPTTTTYIRKADQTINAEGAGCLSDCLLGAVTSPLVAATHRTTPSWW